MILAGIELELLQKDIKNLHLAVYPPDGRVRLAAPQNINLQTLELYVASKIPWIKKQQRRLTQMERQSERTYLDRESHFFLGRKYLLRSIDSAQAPTVKISAHRYIDLQLSPQASPAQKETLLKSWYRSELKKIIAELIPKWEQILNIKAHNVQIRQMRTRWGSCQPNKASLLFNLELAKKPYECIEYVVVHELLHLIERTHNEQFIQLLDTHLPRWRQHKERLNSL